MTSCFLCLKDVELDSMKSGKANPRYAVEIDIQKLIEDFVWKKFLKSFRCSCLRRCFYRRNDYYIDIRWSYFSFEDYLVSEVPLRVEPTKSQTQYSTTYTCQINGPQKHIFNAQGSQMESSLVKLQKNYSIGGKVSIKAAGLEIDASGKRDTSHEEKTDTTTSWSDTAEFSLETNNSAKVVITQEKGISEKYFVVKTVLRLRPTRPGWGAPVIVRKKSNHQTMFEYEIASFRELFEAYSECKDLVEIRPDAHLQFEGDKSQYYDEVYIFSRGILTSEEEKRTVNIAPPEGEE